MKTIYQVLVVFAIFLLPGCSEDSTAPEEDGNYNLETTETIGIIGGTVGIDDFSLSIPAGAFDEDHTIELYASTEDQPFGEDGVSRTFMIDGLPDEYHQPIDLSIKYEGSLSDLSFIAIGEESYGSNSDELVIGYEMFPAADSSGSLHCVLAKREFEDGVPACFFMAAPSSGTNAFRARAVTRQDTIKTDHSG